MVDRRKPVVILGAGGDGRVVAQAVRHMAEAGQSLEPVGFLDDGLAAGTVVSGLPVLGVLDLWSSLGHNMVFTAALQKVKEMPDRIQRIEGLGIPPDRWQRVVHPSATIADDVALAPGCLVLSHATIQPGASVGLCATVRAGACIGHDATMAAHSYLGSNATLAAECRVLTGGHVGPNAVVSNGIVVGTCAVVGIGAVVTRSIPDHWIVFGNPARRIVYVRGRRPDDIGDAVTPSPQQTEAG